MKSRQAIVIIAALLALAACKGERATVTGSYGAGVVAGRVVVTGMDNNSPAGVQVSLRGTGMTTTLEADGGFTFAGVPEGAELIFRRADGIDATLSVPRSDTFLNVALTAGSAKSSSRRRSARGGEKVFEFEGLVVSASATELVVFTSHNEEVTFVIDATTIVRKGHQTVDPAELTADTRVHVKAKKADEVYTAVQVIVQNPAEDDGGGNARPARKEYEGVVRSASATELVIFDSHREEVTFVLNGDTVVRKGNTPIDPADLEENDRVHVKATTAEDGTKTATEVIVQKMKR